MISATISSIGRFLGNPFPFCDARCGAYPGGASGWEPSDSSEAAPWDSSEAEAPALAKEVNSSELFRATSFASHFLDESVQFEFMDSSAKTSDLGSRFLGEIDAEPYTEDGKTRLFRLKGTAWRIKSADNLRSDIKGCAQGSRGCEWLGIGVEKLEWEGPSTDHSSLNGKLTDFFRSLPALRAYLPTTCVIPRNGTSLRGAGASSAGAPEVKTILLRLARRRESFFDSLNSRKTEDSNEVLLFPTHQSSADRNFCLVRWGLWPEQFQRHPARARVGLGLGCLRASLVKWVRSQQVQEGSKQLDARADLREVEGLEDIVLKVLTEVSLEGIVLMSGRLASGQIRWLCDLAVCHSRAELSELISKHIFPPVTEKFEPRRCNAVTQDAVSRALTEWIPPIGDHVENSFWRYRIADGAWSEVMKHEALPCAPPKESRLTFLHCHGNAVPIADASLSVLREYGDVFSWEYSSYLQANANKYGGLPTEQQMFTSFQAAYDFVTIERQVDPQLVVFVGFSLGTISAVEAASRLPCRGLLLLGALASVREAAESMCGNTVAACVPQDFCDSTERIKKVTAPVCFVHGEKDRHIPWEASMKLWQNAGNYVWLPEKHNQTDEHISGDDVTAHLRNNGTNRIIVLQKSTHVDIDQNLRDSRFANMMLRDWLLERSISAGPPVAAQEDRPSAEQQETLVRAVEHCGTSWESWNQDALQNLVCTESVEFRFVAVRNQDLCPRFAMSVVRGTRCPPECVDGSCRGWHGITLRKDGTHQYFSRETGEYIPMYFSGENRQYIPMEKSGELCWKLPREWNYEDIMEAVCRGSEHNEKLKYGGFVEYRRVPESRDEVVAFRKVAELLAYVEQNEQELASLVTPFREVERCGTLWKSWDRDALRDLLCSKSVEFRFVAVQDEDLCPHFATSLVRGTRCPPSCANGSCRGWHGATLRKDGTHHYLAREKNECIPRELCWVFEDLKEAVCGSGQGENLKSGRFELDIEAGQQKSCVSPFTRRFVEYRLVPESADGEVASV